MGILCACVVCENVINLTSVNKQSELCTYSLWMNDSNEHKSPLISFKLSLCITRVCSTYVSHRYRMQVHLRYTSTYLYTYACIHSHWILKYLALSMLANLFARVCRLVGVESEWAFVCLKNVGIDFVWARNWCAYGTLGTALLNVTVGDGLWTRAIHTQHTNRRR